MVRTIAIIFLLTNIVPANAQNLRVMSYNIRFDNPADGVNAWPNRKEWLASQVRIVDPDVLGVQESLPHQVTWLAEALRAYSHVGAGRDENGTGESVTLFYRSNRFDLQSTGTFWLSETPDQMSKGWDANLRRICTWIILKEKKSENRVLVMNAHFDHIGVIARRESAALMVKKAFALSEGKLPVVIIGDFNSTPDSDAITNLRSLYLEARLAAKDRMLPQAGSYNAFDTKKQATQLIDHVFVSTNIKVQRYAMVVEERDGRYPSDHFPVVADLEPWPHP